MSSFVDAAPDLGAVDRSELTRNSANARSTSAWLAASVPAGSASR